MHEIQDSGEEYVTVPPDLLDSRTGEAGGQVTGGGAGRRAEPRGSANRRWRRQSPAFRPPSWVNPSPSVGSRAGSGWAARGRGWPGMGGRDQGAVRRGVGDGRQGVRRGVGA